MMIFKNPFVVSINQKLNLKKTPILKENSWTQVVPQQVPKYVEAPSDAMQIEKLNKTAIVVYNNAIFV